MPETNSLTYRGYAVQDLAENCSFEEVAYQLWNAELPISAQLEAFRREEAAERAIRTAVSFMGMEDPEAGDVSDAATRRKAMRLLAKIPTAIAAAHRVAKGDAPVDPDPRLTFSEICIHLVFGKVPQSEVVKALASTIEPPAMAMAPAICENRPALSGV